MKREIKFRAWDNGRKQMANYVPIIILCDNYIWPHDLEYFHNSQQWTEDEGLITDYELMQFTGLKDKNGKEIYEGDILGFEYLDKYHKGEVMFDDSRWEIGHDSIHGIMLFFEVEIMGNIYENPELL